MVKFFSNFDTGAPTKNYADAVQEYGFDKVVFVRRYKIYLWIHAILPLIIAMIATLWAIYFFTKTSNEGVSTLISKTAGILLSVVAFSLYLLALAKYLNYMLDYTIITPDYVAEYNQSGLFARKITTIEINKIKTINFRSAWFLGSVFNFWRVDILLEWDEWGRWDLAIDFVYDPEGIKYKVLEMMGISEHEKN